MDRDAAKSAVVRGAPGGGRGLGRAWPVVLYATILPISGSVAMVVTMLTAGPSLAAWLREMGPMGVAIFAVSFAILGAIALAPTYTTSVIAGWTFGFAVGFPAVVFGTVGGATLCYVVARWVAAERVASAFAAHPRWDVVRAALVQAGRWKTLWLVFLLRLSPVLPFGTTNVLLATTGVPAGTYVAGTLLGLVPRTGLVALAAAGAQRLDEISESWWLIALGLAATGLCIATCAILGKRALDRAAKPA